MRVFVIWFLLASACFADRPIFLVTPQGVWQSTVKDGKPGPWVAIAADVIVQGFVNGGPPDTDPPIPDPPVDDPIIKQIANISKAVLKDKEDATAVAAIVDSIAKMNLSANDFREALEMAIPIADTSLQANGRLNSWAKQSLAVTSDHAKLKAGLISAWGVSQSTLDGIYAKATRPNDMTVGESMEALNWAQLIEIIMMILTLLKNLGIGGGA